MVLLACDIYGKANLWGGVGRGEGAQESAREASRREASEKVHALTKS